MFVEWFQHLFLSQTIVTADPLIDLSECACFWFRAFPSVFNTLGIIPGIAVSYFVGWLTYTSLALLTRSTGGVYQ